MLYYLLFWMFMGFIIHFYIIFGTNLLTQSPVPVSVFSCFRVSQKRNIKRSPIDLKFNGAYFWTRRSPRSIGDGPEESRGHHEGGGRALPPWARAPTSWLPRGPPDLFPTPTPLIYPQTSRTEPRSGVPPPQASVATKNQSGPCSGTLPGGGSLTGGHLHHPDALHDEEGVVHPRGWGYVPVAMCLISLSLVFLIWHDLDVSRALLL